jgi:DUF4097 and DUF4098 domain-containing protein YvlB
MNRLRQKLSVLGTGVLVVLPACGADVTGVSNTDSFAAEPFHFEFGSEGRSMFVLEGISGEIQLVGSSGNSIIVSGERRVESESVQDAEARLLSLQVEVTESADEILVETIQPDNSQGRNYIVDYEVSLPRDLVVELQSVNGSVSLESLRGTVSVTSVNGTISAEDIEASSVALNLVNGLIDAAIVLPLDGQAELSTVNGNIDLSIPVDTSAEVDASVVTGTISILGLSLSDVETTPRSAKGTLGDGNGSLELSTVNGVIVLRGI